MSKTYTNEEILERLKSLEGLLLERVFETSYSESLRTYDLIDHLRSKAHDLGLEGEDTYTALIRDLEKLSSTIGGLINGKRGELLAAKSLRCLRGNSMLLSNIALPNGDSFEEYDQVLIARSGIYVIEVKNYRNDVVIDDGGILRCGLRSYNVGERMREKMHALWDAIQFSSDGCMSEEDAPFREQRRKSYRSLPSSPRDALWSDCLQHRRRNPMRREAVLGGHGSHQVRPPRTKDGGRVSNAA